ncbi:MAG TPA: tetratricopeptide repeat protein, partial [Bryobacteraceae bacterium]|nr:tetratricopeptide repeat protein [Bryobacteraceae bacterium]
ERAITAAQRGDCAAAIPDLQAILKENERLVPAWNALAVCYATSGHPEQATAAYDAFDRAQRLAPREQAIAKAWFDAAGELATQAADHIEKKEFAEARRLLLRVARPLEGSASWNNLLGYAEFKLGHPEAALARLQKALTLEPDNEDYLLDLGEFLGYYRAPQNAVELFEVASRRMQHSPRVRFGLAVSYILVGRRDDAVKLLETLVQADPKFEPGYRALGECYEDAGNWDGLVRLGKQLQGVNPANPGGWYFEGAGRLKNATEDSAPDPQAAAVLRRAVKIDPRSSRIHFTLAKAYQQSGETELAVRELRETIRLEPEHARAHYVLARLYQKLGQSEAAKREMAAHSRIKVADRKAQYRALLIESRPGVEKSLDAAR